MGLQPGVFGANGDTWRRQRRMVMAGFDPAHVKRYDPSLLTVAQRLAGRWDKAAQSGATVDLQSDLMRDTVDTIAGLAFGAEVNTLGPRICPGRYLALLEMEMKMAMAVLLGRFDIACVDTADGQEPREQLAFTMTPVGLRMRMRMRMRLRARA